MAVIVYWNIIYLNKKKKKKNCYNIVNNNYSINFSYDYNGLFKRNGLYQHISTIHEC
jgi:hypothetical protein